MPLSPGTRLGPYEIVAFLGAGGMGEVYRAQDVRLNRNVAIKILAPALQSTAPLRDRFEREAKAVAALSHPHICTLHDVGQQDGIDFLVMEHLEGETLAARLARRPVRTAAAIPQPASTGPDVRAPGARVSHSASRFEPLPLAEALHIATQLADALSAAHRAGVVHRDLKPGNLMLTKRGVVVLDFGLAKLTASQSGLPDAQTTTDTRPLTNAGAMLGTLPYMAPEQLEGREADARTDIFAFGAILFEMLTGRRAFAGDSQASLIAAILERDPAPLSVLAPGTPATLDRLVRKCLSKDPDARWQSASDIADELRWIGTGSGETAGVAPAPKPGRRSWIIAAGVTVALLAAAAGAWLWKMPETAPPRETTHRQITHSGAIVMSALAPDGKMIAYVTADADGEMRAFVRDLVEGQAVEIVRRRLITDLAWMPDGSRVIVAGFDKDTRAVWSFPRLGGEGQRLRSAPDVDVAFATVAPDGSAVALTSMDQKGFQVITLDGQRREPVRLAGFQWIYDFDWTGEDRIALSTTDGGNVYIVWTVSPTGQDLRRLHVGKDPLAGLCSSPDGRALYMFRNRNDATELVRIRTDSAGEAPPEVVLTAVPVVFSATARLDCSISRDGERMLYSRGSAEANLWKLDINSKGATPIRLTSGTSLFSYPVVSPDGQWILASVGTETNSQIVRMPVAGGEPVKLRAGGPPTYSPDGKRLAFVATEGGSPHVFVSDADGQGAVEVRGAQPTNPFLPWLPDGRLALSTPDATDFRIRSLDDPSRPEEGLQQPKPIGWILYAVFSPRGDRVAVVWNRDKRMALWTMTWPGREARELVAGLWPFAWSADGEGIYAHNERRDVFRVSATSGKSETVATFPTGTLEAGCDVTPDRKTLICAVQEQHSDAWLAEHFDRQAGVRR